jgi:hypothetical protein
MVDLYYHSYIFQILYWLWLIFAIATHIQYSLGFVRFYTKALKPIEIRDWTMGGNLGKQFSFLFIDLFCHFCVCCTVAGLVAWVVTTVYNIHRNKCRPIIVSSWFEVESKLIFAWSQFKSHYVQATDLSWLWVVFMPSGVTLVYLSDSQVYAPPMNCRIYAHVTRICVFVCMPTRTG